MVPPLTWLVKRDEIAFAVIVPGRDAVQAVRVLHKHGMHGQKVFQKVNGNVQVLLGDDDTLEAVSHEDLIERPFVVPRYLVVSLKMRLDMSPVGLSDLGQVRLLGNHTPTTTVVRSTGSAIR